MQKKILEQDKKRLIYKFNGDAKQAAATANHYKELAKRASDVAALLAKTASGNVAPTSQ